MRKMIKGVSFIFKSGNSELPSAMDPRKDDLCRQTLLKFSLPNLRLVCFFDDNDPPWLHDVHGDFSALHTPIIGGGIWPNYVEHYFYDSSGEFAFDNLIYVPESDYSRQEVSLVLIFAHELQHFVQWGKYPAISEANSLLLRNLTSFDPETTLKLWDIPYNREAMIISKRVAEKVFGKEAVTEFMGQQVMGAVKSKNWQKKQSWEFYRDLAPETDYNLIDETDKFVRHYRTQLLTLKSSVDFSRHDWWVQD
jgi:hypothetical protein